MLMVFMLKDLTLNSFNVELFLYYFFFTFPTLWIEIVPEPIGYYTETFIDDVNKNTNLLEIRDAVCEKFDSNPIVVSIIVIDIRKLLISKVNNFIVRQTPTSLIWWKLKPTIFNLKPRVKKECCCFAFAVCFCLCGGFVINCIHCIWIYENSRLLLFRNSTPRFEGSRLNLYLRP